MRKIITGALALSALLTIPFTDAGEYRREIGELYSRGLMIGVSATSFAPETPLTRGMTVTVLWRLEGCPESMDMGFEDVPGGAWYEGGANWAAASGIAGGRGGEFCPDEALDRESLALMMFRLAGKYGGTGTESPELGGFADFGELSPDAYPAFAWAVGAGVIRCRGDRLEPGAVPNRGEAAREFLRLAELLDERKAELPEP